MKKNKQYQNKPSFIKFIAAGLTLVIVVAGGYLFLSKDSESKNNSIVSSGESASNKETKSEDKIDSPSIVSGIEINKSEVSSTAKFYQYESKGIKMEVLALKASDGTIRTALNTCQVCYSSGKGYYVQEGDELVCQNCGNRFTANMVGKARGGCNPVHISDTNKSDDGTKIIIDKNYLDKNKAYFSNWKV